ncbi:putative subtilase-family protease [Actinoplanes missouriensis 431]|uniref:Putative subtilase-family protease n=1 Tax=Actinoplanes missouriensis (strain ATCC 14538 / DSM 43046 / CBS 188.64 / JCM 3121 / NBRC 102363 / NCIMB 12654 / NRRL B-3342 / UNCC 431) TaxID=512565 RepID=I0HIJ1_ACTM4|nr:putative subtilase-family protease [Actinoplanes missouriensis 431]
MFGTAGRRAARLIAAATVTFFGLTAPASAVPAAAVPSAPVGVISGAGVAGAVPGSYIVVVKPEAGPVPPAARALAREYGGTVGANYLSTVRGFQLQATAFQAARLAADPAVAYVEQDAVMNTTATAATPWGLDRIDQRTAKLSGTYHSTSAADVTAYVIDTGIRISHDEFGGRARNGWDFVGDDKVAEDCNGHGTHVAGTIGGATYGVAKDVRLVALKVLGCSGSGKFSDFIAAVDWVTANAKLPAVANMSLGGPVSKTLDAAVNRSIAKGVTYVIAGGNENRNACKSSPGGTPDAITVGAVDKADKRAKFSNYGSCLDLFAPGVNIKSAGKGSDGAVKTMSGTSMAAPHAAGAAAMVLGTHPGWTPRQVRDDLVDNSVSGLVRNAGSGSPNKMLYTGHLG